MWFFPEKDRGKENIFWHSVEREDKTTGERLPDFRRSEGLTWARPMLDNLGQPEIQDWGYPKKEKVGAHGVDPTPSALGR